MRGALRRRSNSLDFQEPNSKVGEDIGMAVDRAQLAKMRTQLRDGSLGTTTAGEGGLSLSDAAMQRSVGDLMSKARALVDVKSGAANKTELDPSFESLLDITGVSRNNNQVTEMRNSVSAVSPTGHESHEYYPELSVLSDILKNMNGPTPLTPVGNRPTTGTSGNKVSAGGGSSGRRKSAGVVRRRADGVSEEGSVASKAEFLQLVVLLRKLMAELDHQKRLAESLKEEGARLKRELTQVTARATQLSEASEKANRADTSLALMERRFATLLKWAREEEQRRLQSEEHSQKLQEDLRSLSDKLEKAEATINIKKAEEHQLMQALQTIRTLEETISILKPRLTQKEVELSEIQNKGIMINQENRRYHEENDRLTDRVVELEANERVREDRLRECERGKELLERELASLQQRYRSLEVKLGDERKARQSVEDMLSGGRVSSQEYHSQHQQIYEQDRAPPPIQRPLAAYVPSSVDQKQFANFSGREWQRNERPMQQAHTQAPLSTYNRRDSDGRGNLLGLSYDSSLHQSGYDQNTSRVFEQHYPATFNQSVGYSSPKAQERTRPRSLVSFPMSGSLF